MVFAITISFLIEGGVVVITIIAKVTIQKNIFQIKDLGWIDLKNNHSSEVVDFHMKRNRVHR